MKMNYEAYQQGIDARHEGKLLTENPHSENTSEHYDWYEGWTDMDEALFRNPERHGNTPQA